MKGHYISLEEAKVNMQVKDNSYGNGVIQEVLKTRIKVKFDSRVDLVTYNKAHIKICLIEI